MTLKKRKSAAVIGTVLHKITDHAKLQPWADYIAGEEPWKRLEISAERLLTRWGNAVPWSFFSAADPRNAKTPGFEHEHGLIVFTAGSGRAIIEELLKGPLPAGLEDGGYVQLIIAKTRHKSLGKYLLGAAERVIGESLPRVYLFVSESNVNAQRFYKNMGYEEVARAHDCLKPGNTEILLTKNLRTET